MRFRLLLAALALTTSVSAAGKDLLWVGNPDASAFPVIRVRAGLRNTKGKPRPLDATRLTLTEAGAAVSATAVQAATMPPVLALVVERSASTAGSIPAIQVHLAKALGTLPKESRAALVTFGDGIDMAQSLTTNRKKVATALRPGPVDTGAALWDGIRKGASMVGGPAGTGLVIAVAASPDQGSKATMKKTVALARDRGVPVYTIGIGGRADRKALHKFALFTGGRPFRIGSVQKLAAAVAAAVKDFRKLPEVTFTSPEPERDGATRALAFTSASARKLVERSYEAPKPPPEKDPEMAAALAAPEAPPLDLQEREPIAVTDGPTYHWVGYGSNGGELIELEQDKLYMEVYPIYFPNKFNPTGPKQDGALRLRFVTRENKPVHPAETEIKFVFQGFDRPYFRKDVSSTGYFIRPENGDKAVWATRGESQLSIHPEKPTRPWGGYVEAVTLQGKTYEFIRFYRDGDEMTFLDAIRRGTLGFDK